MGVLAAQADNRNLSKERIDLAAAYRLIAHFRMDDSIFTHISAKAPQSAEMHGRELFLLNSYGLRFNEVKASELVTVDLDGSIVDDPLGHGINAAGFTIHSAVHAARPDAACVLHTHTVAGVAVSCMEEGLLPLNQWALQFYDRVAYHAYEGIALDMSERDRLVADLGTRNAMILRNHGLMTCGRTVGEAFILMYYLERACQAQLAALSTGRALRLPTAEIAELTARQTESWDSLHAESGLDDPEWNAFVRLIRAVAPDFES
ncbi:class II aldolase/adducin family protein [Ancylobacter amanitiformis]|uniref:Ribulose-5-phosphate 4-epimerase/fuculose-1-phosphate aldolase n=1 Tax=Ancylobacter amanitiformis TaxID=217069 RepID=A0ABU0LPB8_9HYPH|nr:class II aldolase/adducin family protein [Ancylobacter amanitiformis]MDQ0510548.1 ribulose-5-phosphate 4-epimerase/fuculose-1-phosphate aldolase [Ancylobacter amanitiformis]